MEEEPNIAHIQQFGEKITKLQFVIIVPQQGKTDAGAHH